MELTFSDRPKIMKQEIKYLGVIRLTKETKHITMGNIRGESILGGTVSEGICRGEYLG